MLTIRKGEDPEESKEANSQLEKKALLSFSNFHYGF